MLPHSTISAVVTTNKAIKVSSFQNNENIQKKAEGQDCTSSVTLNELAKKAFCIFEFQERSQSKDLYIYIYPNVVRIAKNCFEYMSQNI